MKAIQKRLDRLADRFGSPGETACDLWLRQRLESAKRRIAEAHNRGELPPSMKSANQLNSTNGNRKF